ncbi:MAG: hypothetical protein CM1200mP14_26500 [Gammaproteobacteria bacterium]|nr:MAG: hypothetical protein CM1200mP14_26500 [Gammaproteobacteria bacterium]
MLPQHGNLLPEEQDIIELERQKASKGFQAGILQLLAKLIAYL